jgi:hypothetical protein
MLHASIQDRQHAVGGLPLRQMLTVAHLLRTRGALVDWSEIFQRTEAAGCAHAIRAFMWLSHRLVGVPLPAGHPCDGLRSRLHERRVLVGFAAYWPPVVHFNVLSALDSEYLDALYRHDDRRLGLLAARGRHLARVARRGWHWNTEAARRPVA